MCSKNCSLDWRRETHSRCSALPSCWRRLGCSPAMYPRGALPKSTPWRRYVANSRRKRGAIQGGPMKPERWFYTLPLRLRSLFRSREVEQELDEELQDHLAHLIEANQHHGMSAEEARYAALRSMDGLEQRKEECRDARGVNFLNDLHRDIRFGARTLLRNAG